MVSDGGREISHNVIIPAGSGKAVLGITLERHAWTDRVPSHFMNSALTGTCPGYSS